MDEQFLNTFEDLLETQEISTETQEEVQTPEEETVTTETENVDDTREESNDTPDYADNAIYRFLQERGIKDPSKIQFTNEDDTVEELDFNSLSTEEQLEVLKEITDPGLSEDEIQTINYLRKNNVSLQQVLNAYAEKRLQDYLNEHPEDVHQKHYSIDDYTDDELFIADLKQRYPNFSDEELVEELESAKTNEDIFNRKIEILRNTYKANEDQAEAERQQQEQQQIEDFRNNLAEAASRFNEIQLDYTDDKSDSLVIGEDDKEQMMSFILDQDSEGKSALIKALEDPDQLIELAWLYTQGPKALSELSKYWKGLLATERAENKKLQAKLDKALKTTTTIVPKTEKQENTENKGSMWDDSGLI